MRQFTAGSWEPEKRAWIPSAVIVSLGACEGVLSPSLGLCPPAVCLAHGLVLGAVLPLTTAHTCWATLVRH